MNWWNAILPVVTLILGYFGTLWTEERRDARALARAQLERAALANAARADRQENFELETLTRARVALSELGRMVSNMQHVVSAAAKVWGEAYSWTRVEEEDLQQLVAASRVVRDIQGLILDDATRKAVSAANTKAFRLSGMRSVEPGEIETAWVAYVDAYGVAQDMISQRIREIYKGSVTSP